MEQRKAQVAVEPWDVKQSLGELGLTLQGLHDAVRAGELERVSCTALDPKSYPGTAAWAHSIRRLRADHLSDGWRPQDKNNLPMTVHPDRQIGLLVTSGSPGTGDPKKAPTTKYPKGPMTADQVRVNRQHTIFELLEGRENVRFLPIPISSQVVTWCLLVYAEFRPKDENIGTHIAMCELSLPAAVDEDGYVCEWSKRIILPPVRLDDVPTQHRLDDEDEGEIDVPVARK
jgi:hypothetical protein